MTSLSISWVHIVIKKRSSAINSSLNQLLLDEWEEIMWTDQSNEDEKELNDIGVGHGVETTEESV